MGNKLEKLEHVLLNPRVDIGSAFHTFSKSGYIWVFHIAENGDSDFSFILEDSELLAASLNSARAPLDHKRWNAFSKNDVLRYLETETMREHIDILSGNFFIARHVDTKNLDFKAYDYMELNQLSEVLENIAFLRFGLEGNSMKYNLLSQAKFVIDQKELAAYMSCSMLQKIGSKNRDFDSVFNSKEGVVTFK